MNLPSSRTMGSQPVLSWGRSLSESCANEDAHCQLVISNLISWTFLPRLRLRCWVLQPEHPPRKTPSQTGTVCITPIAASHATRPPVLQQEHPKRERASNSRCISKARYAQYASHPSPHPMHPTPPPPLPLICSGRFKFLGHSFVSCFQLLAQNNLQAPLPPAKFPSKRPPAGPATCLSGPPARWAATPAQRGRTAPLGGWPGTRQDPKVCSSCY